MKLTLHSWLLLVSVSSSLAKESLDLPLCPTSPQYFPQSLPMHCRLPRQANPGDFSDLPQYPTLPPIPDSFFQSLPPDKQPPPIPIPIPPFPGMPMPGHMAPPGAPMPGPMPGMPGPMPGMPGMPGPMPGMPGPMPGMPGMPGPMPMPMPIVGGAQHKLPVIVMPFYSQDHSYKKPEHVNKNKRKPPRKHNKNKKKDSDTDDDSSSDRSSTSDGTSSESSSEYGFWKGRRSARRNMARKTTRRHRTRRRQSRNKKDLLTPILQYVTKDGYVIFEKQISKSEASDWLKPKGEISLIEERDDAKERNGRRLVERERTEKPKTENNPPQKHVKDKRRNPENMMKREEKSNESVETTNAKRMIKVNKHRPMKVNALVN